MKKLNLVFAFTLCVFVSCHSQSTDKKSIKNTIIGFSKAGDTNDADKLETYLDDNYRIVMNRQFGSTKVDIMLKVIYLQKIRNKEFGGGNRKVNIESVVLNGNTASAKVSFVDSKITFISIGYL